MVACVNGLLGWGYVPGALPKEHLTVAFVAQKGRRVLLMDDSQIQLDCGRVALQRAGYDVRIANTLAEFDQAVSDWAPDIVLTDVHMPEIMGNALCAVLKQRLQTERTPVVLFSSLDDEALAKLAKDCGADGFLSKEHGFDRLIEELESLHSSILW